MASSNSFLTSYLNSKSKSNTTSNGASATNSSSSSNSFLTSYLSSKNKSTETSGSITTTNSNSSSNSFLTSYLNSKKSTLTEDTTENTDYNTGGFLGGIGYTLEKVGLGILQSIEGIWDYTASGLAKFFGADDWAEEQVATDWVNYNHADEWYNPSSGWQVAGDVASGIGTSIPAIAAVAAATVISGGTLTSTAATIVSSTVAGLSASGSALKEAYQETGELGGKEYAYAAASGALEGVVEGFEDITGFGSGAVIDNIATTFSKRTAATLAKNSLTTTLVKSFVGEALEEGVEGLIDPYIKRMTYDPDAESASLTEVGYSALIGGLSGMVMGGFSAGVSTTTAIARGNKIISKGNTDSVLQTAKNLSAAETKKPTGYESYETVNALYNELTASMEKTGGQITTIKQKEQLGQLERANTAAAFEPMILSSAQNIYENAEQVAERMNGYYKDADGNPITITAADLTEGIDNSSTKAFKKSFKAAMKTNSKLRGLAIVDATGRLSLDTKAFADATLRGEAMFNQTDVNRFMETASEQELNAVGTQLGVEDWSKVTADELKSKVVAFAQNGGIEQYKTENATVKQLIQQAQATTEAKKNLPRRVNIQEDGVYRYTTDSGVDIAITKQGDSYRVYDYETRRMSKSLTKQELTKTLNTIRSEQEVRIQEQTAHLERQEQARKQEQERTEARKKAAQELDSYASEHVKGYNKLNAANQSMIRSIIRQGRNLGISEDVLISYCNISAHSGLNIIFTDDMFGDGRVDLKSNRIYIKATQSKGRTFEMALIHELTHKLYNRQNGEVLLGAKGVDKYFSAEQKESIRQQYTEFYRSRGQQISDIIIADEIQAAYAERTLSNKNVLEKLVADKTSVKDKVLNFFKGAKTDYESDAKLSRAAEKLYRQYKKLFDKFSKQNYQNNAATADEYRGFTLDEDGNTIKEAYTQSERKQQAEQAAKTKADSRNALSEEKINEVDLKTVKIDLDSETLIDLQNEIKKSGKSAVTYLQDYIFEAFKGKEITFSDGRVAIVDKTDAKKIAQFAGPRKTAMLEQLQSLIDNAVFVSEKNNAVHDKFDYFAYYMVKVQLGKQSYDIIMNVGREKFNGQYHLYSVEEYNKNSRNVLQEKKSNRRDTALSSPVGNLQSDYSSNKSIRKNSENVNTKVENSSENPKNDTERKALPDGNYRYALSIDGETVEGSVEETKNLVAIHNLSEDKLLQVLDLGGFPMPSIAVTKADMEHSGYGDISVIFGKDTIDPQSNSDNKVYSADAYTSRFPQTKIKVNSDELNKLAKRLNTSYSYLEVNEFSGDSRERIISRLKDNGKVRNLFIEENGYTVTPVPQQPAYNSSYHSSEQASSFLKSGVTFDEIVNDKKVRQEYINSISKGDKGTASTRERRINRVNERLDNAKTDSNIYNNLKRAYDEDIRTAKGENEGVINERSYREGIDNIISKHSDEYNAFVESLAEPVLGDTYLRNNKNYYTNSGNPRSFESLYEPYTVDNAVRIMKENGDKNVEGGFFGYGIGELRAAVSKQYKSIDDIHSDDSRIQNLTPEQVNEVYNDCTEEMERLIGVISKQIDIDNRFMAHDIASAAILDIATKTKTDTAARNLIKRDYAFNSELSSETIKDIRNLAKKVADLPVKYFEAKPRRAVSFSEIKNVLIPETASTKLTDALTKNNIPYTVYNNANGQSRTDIIQNMDNVRFALPETDSQGNTLTAQQREYFKDSQVVDENGNLLVMYHGSPATDITKFNIESGTYFTANKDYATRYKKGGKVYEVYLNITNPFDTRNAKEKQIFENEFYGQWGNGARLTENGLPDWTDGYDLVEFIQQKGYKYDGVIVDEGADYGYFGDIVPRGLSYIVFDKQNQVKNTSNKNPTINPDIRYALSDDTDSKYSYAELTAKPDMELTILKDNAVPKLENGKINKALVKAKALANVRKQNNPLNTDEFVYAHNNDADTDIRVTASKLNHGFDRRIEINAKATVIIGDLIKNAIKVNEVNSLKEGHSNDYVLLSAFSDSESTYAVSIYVDRVTNEINGFDSVDILYSVNGKEIGTAAPNARDSSQGLPSLTVPITGTAAPNAADSRNNLPSTTVPTISIAELLEKSNTKFKDIFSKDVYAHFGTEKDTSTKLGSTTRYALPEDTDLWSKDTDGRTDAEKKKILSNAQSTIRDYTTEKQYSKTEAEKIINTAISYVFDDTSMLENSTRAEVIEKLYNDLNTAKTPEEVRKAASKAADYIIEYSVVEVTQSPEAYEAQIFLDEARGLLHNINLDSIKGDIKYTKDTDAKKLYLRWGMSKKRGKGIGSDTLYEYLTAETGVGNDPTGYYSLGVNLTGNAADDIIALDEAYTKALKVVKETTATTLKDISSKSEIAELKASIIESITSGVEVQGTETTYSKLDNKESIKPLTDLTETLYEQNAEDQKSIDELTQKVKRLNERIDELDKDNTRLYGTRTEKNAEIRAAQQENQELKERLETQKKIAEKELKKLTDKQEKLKAKQQERIKELKAKQKADIKAKIEEAQSKADSEVAKWKTKYEEGKTYNSEINKVLYKTEKLKSVKTGEAINKTQYKGNTFNHSIGQLTRIKYRGDFNSTGTRKAFAGLMEWYTPDNPLLLGSVNSDGTRSNGYYNPEVAQMLKNIASNEKPLTDAQSEKINALMEQSGAKTYKELRDWYTVKNLKAKYNADTKELIKELASPTTYTIAEIQQINNLISYFTNFIETYNRIYRNGQLVDALPVAQENIRIIHENKEMKLGIPYRLINGVFNHQKGADGKGISSYLEWFADPMTVARWNDRYQDGFYTQTMQSFREAAVAAGNTEVLMRADIETFYDEHKQWYKELSKRTVEYNGAKMSVTQAMSLYLTLKRGQAQAGLAVSGFNYIDENGNSVRIKGFSPNLDLNEITPMELDALAVEEQNKLLNELTDTDKEYLSLVEDMFNNEENEYSSKTLKYKTDIKLNGYSNVKQDYYFPIYRAFMAKTVDSSLYQGEIDRVSNLGFNKNTVTGAKGELYIEPINRVIDTHIKGVAMYSGMATAIRDYDILFNLDTSGNPNSPVSLRTESRNDWRNGESYFKKLLSDMQGISPIKGGTGIMGKMRSGYAKAVLGANPKVWVTQFSSVFAGTSILDYSSLVQGATLISSQTSDLDEYCVLARARNTENTAAMAQGVLDDVGKVGDVLMKPIGVMDRFVVRWNYAAAQVQVEKTQGLKIGTKENKVAAGKLTEQIILETQQNALATERSAAMRSGSELLKSLTMFTSDAMKVVGRVIDAYGERAVLKARIRSTTDTAVKAKLEARLKEVNRNFRKSLGALTTSAIFMALVAQAFKSLYNRDKDIEDDEDYGLQVLKNMGLDALGNLIGGLPIFKDIYSYLVDGYDISDYSYSTLNDLLGTVGDLFDIAESIFSGDFSTKSVASTIKSAMFTLGKVVGLPISTVYNVVYGLTSRISESAAYKIDDLFYSQSYVSDLADAIEKDDMTLASTIMELLLSDRTEAKLSDTAMSKLTELYKAGYTSILPKSISSTITYNGEEVTLTSEQLKTFESTYYAVNDQIETLISSSTFTSLTEEQQAKAVKLLYDAYYYKALSELTGEDNNTTVGTLSNYIDASKAAMAYAVVATATSETDEDGNTISGSKKSNIIAALQKQGLSDGEILFILCYSAGYTIKDGDYKNYTAKRAKRLLLNYILKLNITQAEKAAIAEECGFTVKNNRIITSDL